MIAAHFGCVEMARPGLGVFFEYRSVFVGFDPIIESEVPEKKIPLGRHGPTLMDAKLS